MSDPQQPGTPDGAQNPADPQNPGGTTPPPPPAPGYTPPAAPGYTPPAAPGYTPPASGAPGYTPPPAPGYTPPAAPGYAPPAAPGYAPPGGAGYAPYATAPAAAPGTVFNGFGLAAIILGGVGLLLCWIPFVNWGSGFFPVVGIVLAIIGMVIKKYKRPLALIGLIVSIVAAVLSLVLAIVITIGIVNAAGNAFSEGYKNGFDVPGTTEGTPATVVLTIEGDAAKADVDYTAFDGGDNSDTVTGQSEALPFTKTYTTSVGGTFDYGSFSVSAMNGENDEGDITCTITVDGQVVDTDTETGAYAYALCDWSSMDDPSDSSTDTSEG